MTRAINNSTQLVRSHLSLAFVQQARVNNYSLVGTMVKDIASGAGDHGFDSRVGQIGHSVANDSPLLRRFFGAAFPRRQAAEMSPVKSYTLRRNIASIMKI